LCPHALYTSGLTHSLTRMSRHQSKRGVELAGSSVADGAAPSLFAVPCPHGDGYDATGPNPEKAIESLLFHVVDAHGGSIPESVKDHIRACAFMVGGLPG
jgi:hypothetical protein